MVLKRTAIVLALALVGCGSHERASEMGGESRLSPEDHERAHRALVMLNEGRIQEGLAELGAITSARPGRGRSVEWMPEALDALLARHELARADSLLGLVGPLELQPPELQLRTGRLRVALGDERGALDAFERCFADPAVGAMATFRAAALHSARGRQEEAAALARRSLAMEPHNDGARLLLVSALLESGSLDDALEAAAQIQDPSLRSSALAEVHLEADEPSEAIAELDRTPDSTDPLHRYLRGRALMDLSLYRKAIDVLEALTDPPFKDSRLLLARCHRSLGEEAEAERYEQLDREAPRPEEARARQRQATELAVSGELLEAHRLLRQAVVLDPENASIHNDLGAVLTRLRRFEDAEAAFLKASDLAPDDSAIYANLAQLYLLMGDPERANEQARRYKVLTGEQEP